MTPSRLARIAGFLYIVAAMGALVPELVRSSIMVPGDAVATAANIRASAGLYRLIFVIEAVAAIPWLFMVMVLYLLLKHVNSWVAAVMVLFAAAGTAAGTLNLLNEYAALTIATDQSFARAFGQPGADSLTQLFAEAHASGFILNAVFYGTWLAPLGYLVVKSGYFPKILGVMLIVGCFGYLTVHFTTFLVPDAPTGVRQLFTLVGGVPEIVFMVWLLVRGARVSPRAELAIFGL